MKKIKMVWAEDKKHAIGKNGQLAWRLADDLKLFKEETIGTLMIMGRTTWETIGKPLPKRTSLVLTRQLDFKVPFDDVIIVHSVDEALGYIKKEPRDITIAGGADIYREFMPYATDLVITRVDTVIDGDTFVEDVSKSEFDLIASQPHEQDERNEHSFVVERYVRQN